MTRDYLLEFDDGPPHSVGSGAAAAGQAPLLTVWGGKITTFRKLAEEAADALQQRLGRPPAKRSGDRTRDRPGDCTGDRTSDRTSDQPGDRIGDRPSDPPGEHSHAQRAAWTESALLPGGDLSSWIGAPQRPDTDIRRFMQVLAKRQPQLPASLVERWARCYGSRVELLLAAGGSSGEQVAPGLYPAELEMLHHHEWARSADDVLWRRTKLGLHLDAAQRLRVAQWWSDRFPQTTTNDTPCS